MDDFKALMISINDAQEPDPVKNTKHFLTLFGLLTCDNVIQVITYLADQSFKHSLTGTQDTYSTCKNDDDLFVYTVTTNWYTLATFYSIMINTRALKKLTAGFNQYIAYKRI